MIDCKGWPNALIVDPKRGSRGQFWFRVHVLGKFGANSWFQNKLFSILSTAFSPIDLMHATFAIQWCLISHWKSLLAQC
jgi:hypothetical protein